MTAITAWQHIFTSVERDRSPNRRRGYQTLFYSREGLDADDLRMLESRAQYYSTPEEPVKRQFFWLSEDRWVVTQAFALAERDEFGRKGRYLSHSLVLSMQAWHQLDRCPFAVWGAKPFINSLNQAFDQGTMQNGNMPPVTFEVNYDWQDSALSAARRWSPEALSRLARLAWQAQDLQAAGAPVVAIGPQENIAEALLVAFLLALPDERRFLTFDTHAVDCNWDNRDFWAQGYPAGQEPRREVVVEASARRVRSDGLPAAEATPYQRWMERIVIPRQLDPLLAGQDWALALDGIIRGQQVDRRSLQGADPTFIRRFAELNADVLRSHMDRLVPQDLSPNLTQRLLVQVGQSPYEQLTALVQGLTANDVADSLYHVFVGQRLPPTSTDQEAMAPLAEFHPGLRRLLRLWDGDMDGWRSELDALGPQDYWSAVQPLLASRAIPSWKAISPKHIATWFDLAIEFTNSAEMVEVAQALAECGGAPAVERLADYVPQLLPADQQRLQTWLKKSFRRKAPRLKEALEQALGKPESAFSRLKGLISRPKEEGPDAKPQGPPQAGARRDTQRPERARKGKKGRRR